MMGRKEKRQEVDMNQTKALKGGTRKDEAYIHDSVCLRRVGSAFDLDGVFREAVILGAV